MILHFIYFRLKSDYEIKIKEVKSELEGKKNKVEDLQDEILQLKDDLLDNETKINNILKSKEEEQSKSSIHFNKGLIPNFFSEDFI